MIFDLVILQMSLYIGNITERVRGEELERVFRRFGHCNVRVKKEGYGFVVFDFPEDAEKALRALKGRNICGERLALTWSNKQPNSNFTRFDRGGRRGSYELQRGRDSDSLGYARRKEGFNGWRNHKMGEAGRGKSVEVPGEEGGYHEDDFKDYAGEEKDYGGSFPDEGGGAVPNLEDNGGWNEPTHDPSVDNEKGNSLGFDRYEPHHGYDPKHGNGDYHVGCSGGSPAVNSQENMGRAQIGEETSNRPNDSKFRQTCYRCGESGHKMRNCPKEHSSGRKYDWSDVGQNSRINQDHRVEDDNKIGSGSLVKLQSSGDTLSMRRQRGTRMSGSRHNRALSRKESPPPVIKETDRHRRREYGRKKRSRNESESPTRSWAKISKWSDSSPVPADYSASRSLSNSQSSKSLPRPTSKYRSRSGSSRAHSSSSKLSSSSKSRTYRGKSLNSRRSSSPTSVSLNKPLSSIPTKFQLNAKSSSINGTACENVDHLVSQGQQIGSTMGLEYPQIQSKDTCIAVNGKAAVDTTVVDAMEKELCMPEDNNENCTLVNPSDGVANLSQPVAEKLSPLIMKETEGFPHSGTSMVDDIPAETQKLASETHVNPHSGRSTIISTEEMCMVLNNYGLELPNDYEKSSTTEAFFGAARLWPWHIVYYRRLKKGPISTENYARRVAQNQEFGIADKYIRSSSGWEEFSLENLNS